MREQSRSFFPFYIALLSISLFLFSSVASFGQDYSFKILNNSGDAITKILVSEDGNEWGFFDIGSGIPSGNTVELAWAANTENQDCKQYFKAVFSDGSESDPVIFDFCEEGLTLEFE